MKKLKRILTGLLAVVLVISNLQLGTLTVNAAEIDDTIVTTGEEGRNDVTPTEPTATPVAGEEEATPTATPVAGEEEATPTATPVAGEEQPEILSFADLGDPVGGYGCEIDVDEDGVATFAFDNNGGYGERYYNLPHQIPSIKNILLVLNI